MPNWLITRLAGKQFIKNILLMTAGTMLSQALVIAASPIITRIYTPAELGTFTVYASASAILAVIASLRYELAIPITKDDESAANLLFLSLLLLCLSCFSLGLAIWIFKEDLGRWLNDQDLGISIWLLPLGVIVSGIYNILTYWSVRQKKFSVIAKTKFVQSFGITAIQIGIGFLQIKSLGLIAGDILGRTLGNFHFYYLNSGLRKAIFDAVSWVNVFEVANRYIRFPLISTGSALFNSAGLYLPSILLAAMYGPQIAGWFALGQRVVSLPISLLGKSVANVYFNEAASVYNQNPYALMPLLKKLMVRMLLVSVLPMTIFGLTAPWLFQVVFGSSWIEAGHYVRVLSITYLVQLVVVPFSQTLNIIERQDLQFFWDIGRLLLISATLFLAKRANWEAFDAILAYTLASLFAYLCLIAIIHYGLIKLNTNSPPL
ncbi:lipopolysaccharide biosynthesis protein [Halomicronema hongdechloris]|uniref:lipopolysaccharide biosynthesis protein n=1 Tax=Halomicronema hongdechloris TaxID=1209493 RepID=UPI0016516D7C|nr:oligosaccharide flippase family protein [Halomicronema hongdechloris]